MTYQAPGFMVEHKIAARDISELYTRNATNFSDDSKRALTDFRQGVIGTFDSNGTLAGIVIDFGTTLSGGPFNRCVIPAGHDMLGNTLEIISGSTPTISSATVHSTGVVPDLGVIDRGFTLAVEVRYWGTQFTNSVIGTTNLAEFWLGRRKTLTSGDGRVDPGFESAYEHDLRQDEYGGRTATLELAPARRQFSLTVIRLAPDLADYATLDEVMRLGRSNPFWYWPPDTEDPGPYLVRLTRAGRRRNDTAIPKTSIKYRVDLEMLEELT